MEPIVKTVEGKGTLIFVPNHTYDTKVEGIVSQCFDTILDALPEREDKSSTKQQLASLSEQMKAQKFRYWFGDAEETARYAFVLYTSMDRCRWGVSYTGDKDLISVWLKPSSPFCSHYLNTPNPQFPADLKVRFGEVGYSTIWSQLKLVSVDRSHPEGVRLSVQGVASFDSLTKV